MAKKVVAVLMSAALCVALGACGTNAVPSSSAAAGSDATGTSDASSARQDTSQNTSTVQVRTSTDKHVTYIKNYVGMNCANVGYTGLDGQRHEDYGNGRYLQVVFVTPDGTHLKLDDEDSEQLRQYKVSAQSVTPNTQIDCTFDVDSDGEEYDNLVAFQSIREIVMAVDKVGESGNSKDMTSINPSPDQYSCYLRDYRDRNLADCGYYSLGGNLVDDYGGGCYIELDILADDGSYVDPSDINSLAQYKVTGQSCDPNTQITLTRSNDSDGREYTNIVDEQSIHSITFNVTHVSS